MILVFCVLRYFPGPSSCRIKLDTDPRKRPNVFTCKSVTKYTKDSDGVVLNACQKPHELSQWLFDNHCMPGEYICNIGPGSGGDILGALMNGNSVVAVESDKHQWEQLRRIALKWSSDETALLKRASQQEGIDLLHHDGQGNRVSNNPVGSSTAISSSTGNVVPLSGVTGVTCAACDEVFEEGEPQLLCESGQCGEN